MNPGIEKLVYKAEGGDITIPGEDINAEGEAIIDKLVRQTAKGTIDRTGNKQFDHTFMVAGDDYKSDIEADEGNTNDLEVYYLGSTSTPDQTIPSLDLIWSDRMNFDPSAEDENGGELRVYRIWNG
jgi:hypothetical protein